MIEMALLLGFALLGLSVRPIFAAENRTCKYNEYTIESESSNLTCLACRNCSAGFGLFPQCGKRIKDNETKNECKPCVRGKTYSAHEDISSCEPCGTCSDHQTIVKNCTLYSDSQCKDICSKGFYFEDLTGDCQPCTWCCPDGSIKVRSGCKDMPFYKQCDVNTAKDCKPECQNDQYVVPGSKGGGHCKDCDMCPPGTVPFPECGSVVENINNISCRERKGFKHSHFKGWWAGILAGGGGVLVILVGLCLWWKCCRRRTDGSSSRLITHEENGNCGITSEGQSSHSKNLMDVGNFGGTTSIQTCANTTIVEKEWNGSLIENEPSGNYKDRGTCQQNQVVTEQGAHASKPLSSLVDDHSDSVENILERLDTPVKRAGHYKVIAEYFGYASHTIKSRFEKSDDGPSRAMIEAIVVKDPELTIEKFAEVVEKKARRKDVALLLRAYDRDSLKESKGLSQSLE